MRSFKRKADNRRSVYLALSSAIESGLRDAYAKRHDKGEETQASIARKLGVSRSTVNKRLRGHSNMTLETVADMVWALGHCIDVDIFDPADKPSNGHRIVPVHPIEISRGIGAPQSKRSSSPIKPKYQVSVSGEPKSEILAG